MRPQKDDKTILSWNALTISAFIKGFKITGNKKYLEVASNAIEFVENNLRSKSGHLYRIYKEGEVKIPAYLDDYAFYVNALLDMSEVKTHPKYFDLAIRYSDYTLEHFWDEKENNFYYTSDIHETLLLRTKILYDLATPSGNSVFVSNLIRLYHITGKADYIDKAEKMIGASISSALDNPFGFGWLLSSSYLFIEKPIEITIFSKNDNYPSIASELDKKFIPNGLFSIVNQNKDSLELEKYGLFKNKTSINLRPDEDYVLICKDFTCTPPITSLKKIEETLSATKSKERIK